MILITPLWQTPDLGYVHKKSSTTPNLPNITTGSTGQLTPINYIVVS